MVSEQAALDHFSLHVPDEVRLKVELEIETEGRGGGIEVFRAGDICLAEDRAGGGHIDRTRGATHVGLLVLETEDLW